MDRELRRACSASNARAAAKRNHQHGGGLFQLCVTPPHDPTRVLIVRRPSIAARINSPADQAFRLSPSPSQCSCLCGSRRRRGVIQSTPPMHRYLARGATREVLARCAGGDSRCLRARCRAPPDNPVRHHREDAVFNATAARISAFNALSSIASPSRISIARRVLPSRLALKRPEGSSKEAPLAKVIFTTLL